VPSFLNGCDKSMKMLLSARVNVYFAVILIALAGSPLAPTALLWADLATAATRG